jgi:ribosomal protein L9
MERNTQNLMAQQIAQGYAQNYGQAQQAAMQADEAARQDNSA